MRLRSVLIYVISCVAFAKGVSLDLTMGHNDRVELESAPSTLYVEDPKVADYEFHPPNWLVIKTKGVGHTRLYALDSAGKVLLKLEIGVHYPISLLHAVMKALFPEVKVKFRTIPKHLIVEGYAPSHELHEKILEQVYASVEKEQVIDKIKFPEININEPSRQINLRVRIVEVRRSISKALGINWDIAAKDTVGTKYMTFQGPSIMSYSSQSNNPLNLVGHTLTTKLASSAIDITHILDLLEQDNFATTVQEPNLTVKAGEEASFSSGGSVPINRVSNSLFQSGTVTYQNYGISLDYKAEFDEKDPKLIKLSVTPEVSDVLPSKLANQNPTILRKKAKTVVELRSGQSIAIAGLVSSTTNSNKSAIPGISDMPVVGDAFRSEDFSRLETEIVFVITPYIVHATQNGMIEDSMDNTGMPKSLQDKSGFIVGEDDNE